jgi:hypothetical protein
MEEAYGMFNFDNIFSATMNIRALKNESVPEKWKNYMRYIIIFVGFGGLSNERTAREHILGYDS